MKVDYNFLDSKYPEVRQLIIDKIAINYDLSNDIAVGIVDYENTEINEDCEVAYNQVKDLMEQDLIKGREFVIAFMAERIMSNDEGKYQLSLKK